MKKMMIAVALIAAACFTSCEKDKDKDKDTAETAACWKITVTYLGDGTRVYYQWSTEAEADARMADIRSDLYDDGYSSQVKSITKEKTSKAAGDCAAE